jgi:hypothetical protein
VSICSRANAPARRAPTARPRPPAALTRVQQRISVRAEQAAVDAAALAASLAALAAGVTAALAATVACAAAQLTLAMSLAILLGQRRGTARKLIIAGRADLPLPALGVPRYVGPGDRHRTRHVGHASA